MNYFISSVHYSKDIYIPTNISLKFKMKVSGLVLLLAFLQLCGCISNPCKLRETQDGAVCVCTANYCDYLDVPKLKNNNDILIVSSSQEGLRFATTNGSFKSNSNINVRDYKNRKAKLQMVSEQFDPATVLLDNDHGILKLTTSRGLSAFWPFRKSTNTVHVKIDRNVQFQNITGFGGAFTGAVSHVLNQLSPKLQDNVYSCYYHKRGIAFNTMRMSIGGSDFDLKPWAYVDEFIGDTELKNFSKLNDLDMEKVKQIKRLKNIAEINYIKIMAAAWSSPRWMKTNNAWTGFSSLKPEFYQPWANYHLRFVEFMHEQGLPVWAISTGNEPMNGVLGMADFLSLGWLPSQMAVWLNDHLGPTIRNSTFKNTLIFGNDDQRSTYPDYFEKMKLARANVLDYLDGLAVHWYTDSYVSPNLIDITHAAMPDKIIMNTESCLGTASNGTARGVLLGSWKRGEYYMHEFIQGFHHHYNGWIDWNLILDLQGGPNYVKNYVDAPIIANVTSGEEIYKQPMYYAIGHFSKFLPEGSVRIETNFIDTNVECVAFKRPDGSIAVILFNSGRVPINVSLNDSVRGSKTLNVPARSFHTIIYN